jgi:PAS domain S-box-containing protein
VFTLRSGLLVLLLASLVALLLSNRLQRILKEIQARDAALQNVHDTLEKRVEERTAELERSLSVLHATLESTADGLLVVDHRGRAAVHNKKFAEMWRLDQKVVDTKDENKLLAAVLDQVKEPEQFLQKIKELNTRNDCHSYDLIYFKDGRVFERYSQPQRLGRDSLGRVWSFRDISERRLAEQRLITQHEVTLLLAEARSLQEVVPKILNALGERLQWDIGVLWVLDPLDHVLRCLEFWRATGVSVPAFEAATRAAVFKSGVGLPGHVWQIGQATWIEDVVKAENFARADGRNFRGG